MSKSIYVFDSGVGGLTVLHQALNVLPLERYTYYADVKNSPYGNKSSEQVKKIIRDVFDNIDPKGVKACVIACNTATSIVVDELRIKYDYPIIGMEPAVKPALARAGKKKIILLATELTLKEQKLKRLISSLNAEEQIIPIPAPELVQAAENFTFHTNELKLILESKFDRLNLTEVGAMVLGCTHFVYFKPLLRSLLPDTVELVDGNIGTIKRLTSLIKPTEQSYEDSLTCNFSGTIVSTDFLLPYLSYCDNHQINAYEKA